MKYYILCFSLVFLLISQSISSQQTSFEFLLANPNDEYFSDFLQNNSGDFIISTRSYSLTNPKKFNTLLLKLNQNGSVTDTNSYTLPNQNISIINLHTKGNNYIAVGSSADTFGLLKDSKLFISNMTDNLTLFDSVFFVLPEDYILGHVCSELCPDEKILIGGEIVVGPHIPRPYLYKLNAEFDSLAAKFYLDDYGTVSHIKELDDGTYWFTKNIHEEYQIVDTNLNYLYATEVPDNLTANFGVKWDTDTSFYLVGDKVWPLPSHKIGFIKQYHPTDTTNHLFNLWNNVSDTIDFPAVWNGIDLKNKDSVFIGGTHNLDLGSPSFGNRPSWFVILQTDSMLNIRWERFYGGDAYYLMGKIIATRDGGCLVGGTRFDYQNGNEQQRDVVILKFNSEGLITSSPEHTASDKMHEAIVYPNPGTDRMQVRVAVQYPQSTVELYDISGNLVARKNIEGQWGEVNTAFLPQGTYVYRITSSSGLFETGKWVKQ